MRRSELVLLLRAEADSCCDVYLRDLLSAAASQLSASAAEPMPVSACLSLDCGRVGEVDGLCRPCYQRDRRATLRAREAALEAEAGLR